MDEAGHRAFRRVQARHAERESYREMLRLVLDAAADAKVALRVDAAHFLAINLETMVMEPMGERMECRGPRASTRPCARRLPAI